MPLAGSAASAKDAKWAAVKSTGSSVQRTFARLAAEPVKPWHPERSFMPRAGSVASSLTLEGRGRTHWQQSLPVASATLLDPDTRWHLNCARDAGIASTLPARLGYHRSYFHTPGTCDPRCPAGHIRNVHSSLIRFEPDRCSVAESDIWIRRHKPRRQASQSMATDDPAGIGNLGDYPSSLLQASRLLRRLTTTA